MRREIFAAAYGAAMARLLVDYVDKHGEEPTAKELSRMIDFAGVLAKLAAETSPEVILADGPGDVLN